MIHIRNTPLLAVAMAAALAACGREAQQPAAPQAPAATEGAPATAAAEAASHDFAIGGLQATALKDGGLAVPNDNSVFGVGLTPDEVAGVLSAAGLPTDALHLSVQPLLVRDGGRVMLFDTGAGRFMGEGAGRLGAALQAAGVEPAQVTDVFISHAHGDHVGGLLDAQGALAFPNATVHISQTEWEDLQAQAEGPDEWAAKVAAAVVPAVASKLSTFAPDAELVPGLVRAVPTPGHTPGHVSFRIGRDAQTLLYVGDVVHHPVVSVQRPQWTLRWDRDAAAGAAQRTRLLEELAGSGERVYAVHFPFPGLGRIQRGAAGQLAWVAE